MSLRPRSSLPLLSAVLVASFTLKYEDRLICFVKHQIGTFPMENIIVWAWPRRRRFIYKNNQEAGIIWKPTGRITRFAQ